MSRMSQKWDTTRLFLPQVAQMSRMSQSGTLLDYSCPRWDKCHKCHKVRHYSDSDYSCPRWDKCHKCRKVGHYSDSDLDYF
eukprot:gene9193-biopygen2788